MFIILAQNYLRNCVVRKSLIYMGRAPFWICGVP